MVDAEGEPAFPGGRRARRRAVTAALAITALALAWIAATTTTFAATTTPATAARKRLPPKPALPPAALTQSPDLWATIDICNTSAHPHILGLRASIPGTGHRKDRLAMRFRAQFEVANGQWVDLPGADSGYRDVGSAIYRARQSGWNFTFLGAQGGAAVLRGLVQFRWRRAKAGSVRYQTDLTTTGGHPTGSEGDPPNFSADTCTMP